jgi:hypothetical protein
MDQGFARQRRATHISGLCSARQTLSESCDSRQAVDRVDHLFALDPLDDSG